jgi:hypothetical protein
VGSVRDLPAALTLRFEPAKGAGGGSGGPFPMAKAPDHRLGRGWPSWRARRAREGLPAFHTFFAVPNREQHKTARRVSHPYYPDAAAIR